MIFLPVPARATELNIGSLTVIRYGLGHRKAAHEAVAVCWRQYGWSVIADGAVIVCCTCVLVCGASISAGTCDATCASGGAGCARIAGDASSGTSGPCVSAGHASLTRVSEGACVPTARSGGTHSTSASGGVHRTHLLLIRGCPEASKGGDRYGQTDW